MPHLSGPEFYISKRIGRAIMDYQMLNDGDKIAVAVSGGKDSLTLLRVLNDRRSFVPIKYELLAVYIDTGYPKSISRQLEKYFKKIKVNYHIEKVDVFNRAKKKEADCFWCSENRKKALFKTANRFGSAKVALGHHMDDIIETMLLDLFFHGEISALPPTQELFKGKIKLIRPLAYVEEYMIVKFAKEAGFPDFPRLSPGSLVPNQAKMGAIIGNIKKICPDVKKNIYRSLQRIKKDYLL